MPIKKISYLPLNTDLKFLRLSGVKLAKWDGPSGWQPEETEEIVSRISQMSELQTLNFYSVPIGDSQLERLLSNLECLRHLEISGTFGETNLTSANIGQITDRGCVTIARLQPNLQSLELDYQRTITKRGASAILEHCLHLRDLSLQDSRLIANDVPDLLEGNRSLLFLTFRSVTDQQSKSVLLRAMKATGGRTLLKTPGLVQPDGLNEREKRQWDHTKQLIENLYKDYHERYNMWEPLWDVDISIE